MSCSPDNLKDYFFGELPAAERSAIENHIAMCDECRDEYAALDSTRTALLAVADEEPPRRIAFVSDKVFEPRWWQRMWNSGPQLGFGAAAMLAAAIIAHGFLARPVTGAPPQAMAAQQSLSEAAVQAEVEKRVEAAVARVMADAETKQLARVLDTVNTRLRQHDDRNRGDLVEIRDYIERMEKRNAIVTRRVLYE